MFFVYGFNKENLRKNSWEDLTDTTTAIYDPWHIVGDYNVVLNPTYIVGEIPLTMIEIANFHNWVSRYQVHEMKRIGVDYT